MLSGLEISIKRREIGLEELNTQKRETRNHIVNSSMIKRKHTQFERGLSVNMSRDCTRGYKREGIECAVTPHFRFTKPHITERNNRRDIGGRKGEGEKVEANLMRNGGDDQKFWYGRRVLGGGAAERGIEGVNSKGKT